MTDYTIIFTEIVGDHRERITSLERVRTNCIERLLMDEKFSCSTCFLLYGHPPLEGEVGDESFLKPREYHYTDAWQMLESEKELAMTSIVEAIKALKARTGCSVSDAKAAVELCRSGESGLKQESKPDAPEAQSGYVVEAPRARRNDPAASHKASVRSIRQSHELILEILKHHGPQTDEAILTLIRERRKMSDSGARTRRSELVSMGYVRDSGKRSKTAANRETIVWECFERKTASVAVNESELERKRRLVG